MSITTGALIVGALGMIYGLSFAFVPALQNGEASRDRFAKIGAFVLLVAALALIVIPYLMGVR